MTGSTRLRPDPVVAAVFLLGLALSLLLALRSQPGGDQLNLLARGWLLLARGEWVPYGNPASSGGAVPGGVTALLVAGPLALWRHHRAAVLGELVLQVAAFLLLDRWLRAALDRRGRRLFAVLYWLNPWRLLLSGFLWNPGYLLLVGAVHAWGCWQQRSGARFAPSLMLAAALGIGLQVHPAVVLLGVATLLLLLGGHLRLRWSGILVGSLLAVLPLVPWLFAVAEEAGKLPVEKGFLGRGLVLVFPLLRGVLYWFRHASLELSSKELQLDFAPWLGAASTPRLDAGANLAAELVGAASLLLPLLANLWLWRGWRRHGYRLLRPGRGGRAWVASYTRTCFVAAVATYALAPTTVMWWQGVPVLHAAVLPVALWGAALWRLRYRAVVAGAWAWGCGAMAIALAVAVAGPRHRCGGRENIVIPLRHDHEMLHQLRIHQTCPVPITADGWWPDVLPEPTGERRGDPSAARSHR